MSKNCCLFILEFVMEGYLDKICDQIFDSILDEILKKDFNVCVVCEMFVIIGLVFVSGEIIIFMYVDILKMVC